MNIQTIRLCDQMQKTGQPKRQNFAEHFGCSRTPLPEPGEIDRCLSLLRDGKLKVHHLAPRGEELESWTGSCHEAWPDELTVRSLSPIDAGFVEAVQQLPGTDLFAAFAHDTECLYVALEQVFKVENHTDSVVIEPFEAFGFSDGFEIVRFKDVNALVRRLFLETVMDDPLYIEHFAEAHPFQALFHGFEVGPCIRLAVAAQERRLSRIPAEQLRGSVDGSRSSLLVENEFRDTALHIAARTGEITALPEDLLDPKSLFRRGNGAKTVMQAACEAGLEQWLQNHLLSRPREDWENVYLNGPVRSLREELPQWIVAIPQVQKVIQEHLSDS